MLVPWSLAQLPRRPASFDLPATCRRAVMLSRTNGWKRNGARATPRPAESAQAKASGRTRARLFGGEQTVTVVLRSLLHYCGSS